MTVMGLKKIVISVRDQGRAVAFWTERMDFTVTMDAPYDELGGRWIEVTSPDGGIALVLDADPDREPSHVTPFFFYADDIQATYHELRNRGVEFPEPPQRQPWGWWCRFADDEGNRFTLQER